MLDNNQSLMVFIASNYTQGDKTPTLNASILAHNRAVRDHFLDTPLARGLSNSRVQNYAGR